MPDELVAHGHTNPEALYSVYFEASDLWGEDAGNHRVYLDLYETCSPWKARCGEPQP